MSTCNECRFFLTYAASNDAPGVCRRHPPVVALSSHNNKHSMWPEVTPIDWCGEFEALPELEEETNLHTYGEPVTED